MSTQGRERVLKMAQQMKDRQGRQRRAEYDSDVSLEHLFSDDLPNDFVEKSDVTDELAQTHQQTQTDTARQIDEDNRAPAEGNSPAVEDDYEYQAGFKSSRKKQASDEGSLDYTCPGCKADMVMYEGHFDASCPNCGSATPNHVQEWFGEQSDSIGESQRDARKKVAEELVNRRKWRFALAPLLINNLYAKSLESFL